MFHSCGCGDEKGKSAQLSGYSAVGMGEESRGEAGTYSDGMGDPGILLELISNMSTDQTALTSKAARVASLSARTKQRESLTHIRTWMVVL